MWMNLESRRGRRRSAGREGGEADEQRDGSKDRQHILTLSDFKAPH